MRAFTLKKTGNAVKHVVRASVLCVSVKADVPEPELEKAATSCNPACSGRLPGHESVGHTGCLRQTNDENTDKRPKLTDKSFSSGALLWTSLSVTADGGFCIVCCL